MLRAGVVGLLISTIPVFSYSSHADLQKQIAEIAQSPTWLKLLHQRSTPDGPNFYLSHTQDPYLELQATLAAFQNPESDHIHPNQKKACLFPARYQYLKSQLTELPFPAVDCPDFTEWKTKLSARAISVVFSAAYANNPASMFGHTLLRIHRSTENSDLLDYGVNFAADADAAGIGFFGLSYVFKGLMGGYQGYFNLSPYYQKLNEYSSAENRDLWEYELNLSGPEIEQFMNHLWELYVTTYFDYYFLDENCSSMILEMIEVVKPELNFSTLKDLMVVPGETLRDLTLVPGLVRETRYRPSLRKKVLSTLDALTDDEKNQIDDLRNGKLQIQKVTSSRMVSAWIDYLHFLKYKKGDLAFGQLNQERMRTALIHLSKLQESPTVTARPIPTPAAPHQAHYPTSWAAGVFLREIMKTQPSDQAISLRFQGGFHDFLADPSGYSSDEIGGASIRFLDFNLHYLTQQKRLRLESLMLFDVKSLFPIHRFDSEASWTITGSLQRFRDGECKNNDCSSSLGFRIMGAPGLAKKWNQTLLYSFLGLSADVSSGLIKNIRTGPELQLGLVQSLWDQLRINPLFRANYDGLVSGYSSRIRQNLSISLAWTLKPNYELRFSGSKDVNGMQALIEGVLW
jgi:hypothetical protein